MSTTYDPELIGEVTQKWAPESRQAMLQYLSDAHAREAIKARYSTVADLARAIDPTFVVTPALDMISQRIEVCLQRPRRNLLITMPPQEGKSTICAVYTPLRALQLNPNRRIILATYAANLALDHSRECRDLISRHGSGVIDPMTGVAIEDKLGFRISPTAAKAEGWRIAGSRGGMVATGLDGSITGRAADLFIIDDPYKNMQEADSATQRAKVNEWMQSVARTRLSPSASMILIQTRWHPEDLAGQIIERERELDPRWRTWHHINIPAIAEEGLPDALGRAPGEAMVSARGRTPFDFEATRADVGERVWYALYQGSPRNPAGGLFMRKWFEDRLEAAPERPVAAVIGIDPADSGHGDETGIIGAVLAEDGTIVLAEDWSARFTADEWSRQAVWLALRLSAREIALEAYSAADTYVAVVKRAWKDIHREVLEKRADGAQLTWVEERALTSQMPFMIRKWRAAGTGDPVGRSSLLRQACETGKCKVVENKLAVFVDQAADWQAGQHQPDRVSAAIVAHDRLAALGSGRMTLVPPLGGNRTPPAWLRRRIG